MNFKYDTQCGECRFWDVYQDRFDLTEYLYPTNHTVNCYDQAYGVVTLGSLAGMTLFPIRTRPFGFINPTKIVGVNGLCNNPFYQGTNECFRSVTIGTNSVVVKLSVPRVPFCSNTNYVGRSAFGNHMYAIANDSIFDACAGPVLGTQSLTNYLDSVVDHSSRNEERYSCFALPNPYGFNMPNTKWVMPYSLK